ncbi:unnamed protein product [Phytomonas sp. Hart1]|nr:unnamed protein product [Phytomonas sp. Hart1]|eukprot:CCW69304.1 unnamed protein product [Phytomonas sp. isolate Hart1]
MPVEIEPQEVQYRSIPHEYYDIHKRIAHYVEHPESFTTKNHVVEDYLSHSLPTEPSQKIRDISMQVSSRKTTDRHDSHSAKRFVGPSHLGAQKNGKRCVSSFDLEKAYNDMLVRIKERLAKETNQTDAQNNDK